VPDNTQGAVLGQQNYVIQRWENLGTVPHLMDHIGPLVKSQLEDLGELLGQNFPKQKLGTVPPAVPAKPPQNPPGSPTTP
jgi:hypothetical protein